MSPLQSLANKARPVLSHTNKAFVFISADSLAKWNTMAHRAHVYALYSALGRHQEGRRACHALGRQTMRGFKEWRTIFFIIDIFK